MDLETGATGITVRGVSVGFDGVEVLHGVDLDVAPGSVVALLGPSGCGKTTLLRAIAGLEVPTGGEVRIGDRVVSAPGSQIPPERRRIGMVFQDWALFPHLTVAGNVAFGLPRGQRKGGRVDAALDMVGLSGFGERAPGTLSGGQQQRVALARALAPEPSALLLDEPFSNLDTTLRAKVRTEVHELLHRVGITTVFVTHDQDEAFVLGDEVAVMSEGLIVQQAPPHRIYSEPADTWVARFVGDANIVAGTAVDGHASTSVGRVPLRPPGEQAEPAGGTGLDGSVEVLFRPEDLRLLTPEERSADGLADACDAEVDLVEYYGHDTVYVVTLSDGTQVRVREVSVPRFDRGDRACVITTGAPAIAFAAP